MKAATRAEARATATEPQDAPDERHGLRMELLRRNLRLPQTVLGWWLRSEEAGR